MDTEALRWFQQIADGATVTEVAELSMVSQPGVSRALGRLEQEIGTALLQRSGRVLRLTHAGSVFKRHVDAVLHDLDDGMAAVAELLDPETGTVSVAFQLSLGTWLVPGVIAAFRAQHPRIRFRLAQSDDALGTSVLSGGRTDLEFTSRRPTNDTVQWERLFAQSLFLAVPPNHRLADRAGPSATTSLAEVAEDDFVVLDRTWELRRTTDALCAAAGFHPRVAFESDDLQVVRGFVAAGLGVALVPATEGEASHRSLGAERLLRLTDPHAYREIGLAWSSERRLLPSAQLFRSHVLADARRPRS